MTIKCDTHIHSRFSMDCKTEIEDLCRSAVEKGLKVICITDHLDYDKRSASLSCYHVKDYFEEVDKYREIYKDELIILRGVEFSEPHLYPAEFEKTARENYDMIIGAIHWTKYGFVGDAIIENLGSREDIESVYYNLLEESVEHGKFDTLAHFDIPKRYYKSTANLDNAFITRILGKLISKDIAIEINTSTLRRGTDELMPSVDIIDKYIELGGRKITIGSDAHYPEHLQSDFGVVPKRYHQYIGVFINRKFVYMHSIE